MNEETMKAITSVDEYFYCVGRIIFFCQCIEHDVKKIYLWMRDHWSQGEEDEVMNRWTLGEAVNALHRLDSEAKSPYFSSGDYKLLGEVTKIRNHCVHKCFQDWVYKIGEEHCKAYEKSASRMLNEHNRLAKVYRIVEMVRIEYTQKN